MMRLRNIRTASRTCGSEAAIIEAIAQMGLVSATRTSRNHRIAEAMNTLAAKRTPSRSLGAKWGHVMNVQRPPAPGSGGSDRPGALTRRHSPESFSRCSSRAPSLRLRTGRDQRALPEAIVHGAVGSGECPGEVRVALCRPAEGAAVRLPAAPLGGAAPPAGHAFELTIR